MDFDLSKDQRALNAQIDRVVGQMLRPSLLHRAFDGDEELLDTMARGLFELGLGGVLVPEEHGGLGLGLLETASISERLGFWGAPGAWLGHALAGYAIARAGSVEQRARWLPSMTSGETVATVALMEEDAWDPGTWTMSGERTVSGEKHYVPGVDKADLVVVGLSENRLGLIDMTAPGAEAARWASTDRTRPIGQLSLSNAAVELLPKPFAESLLSAALVLIAADAHGGSLRVRDDIVEYSKQRRQFDRAIAEFQAVKHKLADLTLHLEFNGALHRQAAARCDAGSSDAATHASNAKAHLTDTFAMAARIATEGYGGIGYTWEHPAHIWLRRSLFDFAWLGQPEAHRQRVAERLGW
jgi:alkylation response protein AidB-like acyl-CoA dehydrogenase